MRHYTKEDIIRLVEEEDVEFIRLQFTDTFGNLKNIAVTTSQLERVLDNQVVFDGSSIAGFVGIEDSDMCLHPDLDTFVIFPWRPQQGKVARFLCDIYRTDGTPFEGDPRYILKQAVKEAGEAGYTFMVGPECEFFLFNMEEDGRTTTKTGEQGTYFDVGPMDEGENARREMVMTLEEMGFTIEASHHEVSPAQHEIDIRYADALTTADNIMTFKLTVRTIARRHGLHATFMPKPVAGIDGSGMHINMSLFRDGKNCFDDPAGEDGLSKEAYQFMAGILKYAPEMSAITNPLVNSYKRLVPGYEAPIYIAWSTANRSPLVRFPSERGVHARVEFRSPDSSANPYLALALCLRAGLKGMKEGLTPPPAVSKNLKAMSEAECAKLGIKRLPATLKEALEQFAGSEFAKEVLGEHSFYKYLEIKWKEWEDYSKQVTPWEIEQYLDRF